MLRIAGLLSHHSFGVKNSIECQKNLLIKSVKRSLPALSRFPPRLDFKLSSSWQVQVQNYRPNNGDNNLSNISSTSVLFDFGFQIQNKKVRLAR